MLAGRKFSACFLSPAAGFLIGGIDQVASVGDAALGAVGGWLGIASNAVGLSILKIGVPTLVLAVSVLAVRSPETLNLILTCYNLLLFFSVSSRYFKYAITL